MLRRHSPILPVASEAPTLVPLEEAADLREVVLDHAIILVGSKAGSDVLLSSERISSRHAVIVLDCGRVWVKDLASRTGTSVNGKRVPESLLQNGDVLTIGPHSFKIVVPAVAYSPTETTPPAITLEFPDELRRFDGRMRVVSLGRRPGCGIFLPGHRISTTHALLCQLNQRWFLRDTFSRSGTFLNKVRVREAELLPGDVLSFSSGAQIRIVEDPLEAGSRNQAVSVGPVDLGAGDIEPLRTRATVSPNSLTGHLTDRRESPGVVRVNEGANEVSPEHLERLFGTEELQRDEIRPGENEGGDIQPPNDQAVELGPLAGIIPDLASSHEPVAQASSPLERPHLLRRLLRRS